MQRMIFCFIKNNKEYGYVPQRMSLVVSKNLSGSQSGILPDVVQFADGCHTGTTLASNRVQGLASADFVKTCRRSLPVVALDVVGRGNSLLKVSIDRDTSYATKASGFCRLTVVGGLAEYIVVTDDILIFEVKHQGGVQGYTAKAGFKMQV